MPDAIQTTNPNQVGGDDDVPDTEAEFKSLFLEAQEGAERFAALAKAADVAAQPAVAAVYREVGGTVMTLLMDLTAATGGAVMRVEDQIDDIPEGGGANVSGLLEEDAEKYLQLFEQYIKLLDGLVTLVPSGTDGDAQREVFATLRRMTDGMIEYTNSIVIDDDDDDDDPEPEIDPA